MLHGHPPFRGLKDTDRCREILSSQLKFKSGLSDEVRDLITRMLMKNPKDRLSITEILMHQWVEKFADLGDFHKNQHVTHIENGEGFINDIKGVILNVNFPDRNLNLTLQDAMTKLKVVYHNEIENGEDFRDTAGGLGLFSDLEMKKDNSLEVLQEISSETYNEEDKIEIIENPEDEIEIFDKFSNSEDSHAIGLFNHISEIDYILMRRECNKKRLLINSKLKIAKNPVYT